MKVKVNNETCIGCGACTFTCGEVFGFNDKNVVVVKVPTVPENEEENAKAAMEGCPVGAITSESEDNTNQ